MKQALIKKGLQKNQVPDSYTFLLKGFINCNYINCDFLLNNDCFAQVIMSKKPDFQEQYS